MIEYRMPIPARAYNTAVGGHVCGPEDIDFGQKVVHLIKYDRNGNEVSFESQVTQANKIYVIHYDFTLSSNVTIPASCVLEFEGGSISGNNTLNLNNCFLNGNISILSEVSGDIYNSEVDVRWFGAKGDDTTDNAPIFQKVFNLVAGKNKIVVLPSSESEYIIGDSILIKNYTTFKGCGGKIKLKDNYTRTGVTQYVLFNLNQNNVTIDGIEIDGNSANQTETPTVCDLITIVGEHSKVVNCKLYNSPDSGIMFSGVKDGECCNNYIDGANDLCIYVNDGSTDSSNLERCLISHNILKNGNNGGIGCKRTASKIIISENIIESCGHGITLERASTNYDYATNLQIVNNLIRNTTDGLDISIFCSNNVICCGNKIENAMNTAIQIAASTDCVISNNIIKGKDDYTYVAGSAYILLRESIVAEGEDAFIGKRIIIMDNIIIGEIGTGMWFRRISSSANNAYLEHSIISRNIINCPNTIVLVELIKNSIISENVIFGATGTYGTDFRLPDNTTFIKDNWVDKAPMYSAVYGRPSGTYDNKPTSPRVGEAYYMLDSTKGTKPIYWNGFGWVDSAGNGV